MAAGTADRTTRTVALALAAQHNARRGAAASAEARTGLSMLHQGMIEALRRQQRELARRRIAAARSLRIDGVRMAYASASASATAA
jgi:hypothetical protein